MGILAAMSLLRAGRAFRIEPWNGIDFKLGPACQKVLEETMTDDLLYGFDGEDC